tara:strand:- start:2608 stop:3903 length:1296 start_codon:yes stop_codon:yes gene_type:complete
MPRDAAGSYTLVAGNPVLSGTVISSSWANATLNDVSTALTDSLDRYGRGGMLSSFRFADGTKLLPSASFVNETSSGLYREDSGDVRMAILTQDVMRWQTSGVQIWDNVLLQWFTVTTTNNSGDLLPLENTWTGVNTFNDTIVGSISGNAVTVTNGVYTVGDQAIAGVKTFSDNVITNSLKSEKIQIDDGNDGGTLSLGALSGLGTMIKGYSVDHPSLAETLEFYTGNAARMSINSVGFVSIGSVLADESLVVGGDLKINNAGTGSGNLHFGTTSDQTRIVGRDSSHGGVPDTMEFFTGSTKRCTFDASGALILAGSAAQKASGTTWSNPSDSRLKDNVVDYTKGSAELMQVRVCEWDYNGKGGTVAGMRGLGVIADEVMEVLPNTVTTYSSPMNPEDETAVDIKKFDATEITWLLVKTVQELTARIEALEA